ncbi:hypothetical protein COU74_04635 [Candidatus Peregrinibacteria bacterium CG10_big_fil_rev_8_21_14_0_10_36_19]|nr:MAG: hypothetical protein COU74_04635 [Candidatus Peregrinibacteria bacterium CG10_big_fil_rev_8_21_14_0_10_36_19]
MNKKGFTLVEILIVMMIVAVLSSLAVNGYTSYRKYALVDLSADSLIAQMNEARDKAAHGVYNGESPKCYGFYFDQGSVKGFDLKYSNKKIWDEFKKDWVFSSCLTFDSSNADFYDLDLDNNLLTFSGADMFALIYYPPSGDVISYDPLQNAIDDKVKIDIQYGSENNERFKKEIFIDVTNGHVDKK